ncbi:MAG TPA: VWA domain-containing protein, partial [Deltaproteobacteria bacterium]|nr:VWA domain-containing protein [Deltaproteobacteria bacterium]
MLPILALLGCDVDPIDAAQIDVIEAPVADGVLHIATAPDRRDRGPAPVREAPLPEGQPVLNDCFGGGPHDATRSIRPTSGTGSKPSASGGRKSGVFKTRSRNRGPETAEPPTPPPPPPPAQTLSPSREQTPQGSTSSAPGGGGALNDVGGGDAVADVPSGGLLEGRFAKKANKKKPDLNEQAPADPRSAGETRAIDELAQLGYLTPEAEPMAGEDQDQELPPAAPATPAPVLDWGATVYLSNDDSMSLASAQRVLYSLTNGARLSPSEIRPHELLNYFSFDTAGPPTDQTFSVLGAAEQDGDTLTVSLAVHGANPPRQPLDLTILLDRSCSMQGEGRMSYTKRGLSLLSDQLQRGDRVDLVLFDSGVCTPLQDFVVGRDDPALLTDVIQQLAPTGSTDLYAGLQEAYRIQTSRTAADVHQRNRRVLLITDALLNSGNVDKNVVSTVGGAFEDDGIRLTGVGVGRNFDDTMLDKLTEKGKGAYVYLGSEA